jgi:hypothetical protein
MEEDPIQMTPEELWAASEKVQNFLMQTAPMPGDGIGIAAMILVNFMASGVACGAMEEAMVEDIIHKINLGVWETLAHITKDDTATQTVQ